MEVTLEETCYLSNGDPSIENLNDFTTHSIDKQKSFERGKVKDSPYIASLIEYS